MDDAAPPPELERLRPILTRFAEEKSLQLQFSEGRFWLDWGLQWRTGNDFDCSLLLGPVKPRRIYVAVACNPPSYRETYDTRRVEIALFPDDPSDFTPHWAALEAGVRWGESCVEVLDATGRPALEPFLERLRGESWLDRWTASLSLGRLGDPRAIPALIHALEDESTHVRTGASMSLSRLGAVDALPAIEAMKKRTDPQRSNFIQEAIDELRALRAARDAESGAEPATPQAAEAGPRPVSPAATPLPPGQENLSPRREPPGADPSAELKRLEPVLKSFADDFRLRLELKQDSWGCHWRLRWITSLGEERAIGVGQDNSGMIHVWVVVGPSCHAEAFDDRTTHIGAYPKNMTDFGPFWAALEAGVRRGETTMGVVNEDGRPAIEKYIRLLQHDDPKERRTAAGILGDLGDRNAAPALLGALKDVDRTVRLKAAEGLGVLGAPDAAPELERMLAGADDEERSVLQQAIERIQRKLAFMDNPAGSP